jgi:hypothetical protein
MKLHIFKYFCLSVLLLTVASCITQDYGIQAPQLSAVSNLQYTLNGDSVKLTWTLPKVNDNLSVSIMYNGGTIQVSGNPTFYTFGIVQTNVDYMFTVKAQDTKGNLSLGQTVKFNRPGATPVTNLQASQTGSNSVALTWTLPSGSLSGITVTMGSQTVALPATATSYQFDNVSIGTHLFGVVTTNTQNQVSNTVYMNFKVGPTVVAYLGTDADSLHISNHEQAAAAKWLFANYPAARYVTFNEIKNGTVNLSQFDVVWWNYDVENGPNFPAIATDPTVLASIQSYYQNGGKLLCGFYAFNYLWNLGRLPTALQSIVENDAGTGSYNPDIWTVNADIDGNQDNTSNPLFTGLTFTTQGDGEKTFPVIGAGWKENHNCVLSGIPNFFGLANGDVTAYTNFCTTYTAKWLAGWGGISDYFMGGIFEFDPTSTFKGTAIVIGIGGIEWDQLGASPGATSGTEGFTNPYQANVETLYTNALSVLKSK